MKLTWGENHALTIEMTGPEAYAFEAELDALRPVPASGTLLRTLWSQLPTENGAMMRRPGLVIFIGQTEPRWEVQAPPREPARDSYADAVRRAANRDSYAEAVRAAKVADTVPVQVQDCQPQKGRL